MATANCDQHHEGRITRKTDRRNPSPGVKEGLSEKRTLELKFN